MSPIDEARVGRHLTEHARAFHRTAALADALRREGLVPARGIVLGMLVSAVMWAGIGAAAYFAVALTESAPYVVQLPLGASDDRVVFDERQTRDVLLILDPVP